MLHNYPGEYTPPVIVGTNHWQILKFCSHHGTYLTTYDIKIIQDEEGTRFVCTCEAQNNCKHIHMVANLLNPKKDLF